MEKDIGKIRKGEFQGTTTDIVIGIREYNGKIGVDIREFVESDKYSGPTKKGLRIPAESFQKFKEMINSISEGDLVASEGTEQPAVPKEQETLSEKVETPSPEGDKKESLPDY